MPWVYGGYYAILSHLPSSPLHLEPGLRTSKRIFLCQQGAPERNSRFPSSGLPQPGFFNSGAHFSIGTSKSGYSIAAPGDLVSSSPSQTQNRQNASPHTSSECATKPHVPHKDRYQSRPQGPELWSLHFTLWNTSSRHSNVLICRLFVPQAVGMESASWRRHLQALGVA